MIVLDENDNPPNFRGTPYKAAVNEDTPVGTTVFRALEAVDADQVFEIQAFLNLQLVRSLNAKLRFFSFKKYFV